LTVDSYALPTEFLATCVDVYDSKVANELVDKLPKSEFVIADKGYDSVNMLNNLAADVKVQQPLGTTEENVCIDEQDQWSEVALARYDLSLI